MSYTLQISDEHFSYFSQIDETSVVSESIAGTPKKSKETLHQDMMGLDDVIWVIEKELREAGEDLRRVAMEKGSKPKSRGGRMLLEIGPSSEPGVGVNWKGSLGGSKLQEQCWRFAEEGEGRRYGRNLWRPRITCLVNITVRRWTETRA